MFLADGYDMPMGVRERKIYGRRAWIALPSGGEGGAVLYKYSWNPYHYTSG